MTRTRIATLVGALLAASCAGVKQQPGNGTGGHVGETTGTGGSPSVSTGTGGGAPPVQTGICQNLQCKQNSCTMGNCTQTACPNGGTTSVSGTVYDLSLIHI